MSAGGNEPQVVAAVLLFRVLTYGIQIALGGVHVRDLAREEQLAAAGSRGRAGSRSHAGLGRVEVAGDR